MVSRLLNEDPQKRFRDMTEVSASLLALEDSSRALAKYSFRTYVAPPSTGEPAGFAFAKDFYEDFFLHLPEMKKLFVDAQHQRMTGTKQSNRRQRFPIKHNTKN